MLRVAVRLYNSGMKRVLKFIPLIAIVGAALSRRYVSKEYEDLTYLVFPLVMLGAAVLSYRQEQTFSLSRLFLLVTLSAVVLAAFRWGGEADAVFVGLSLFIVVAAFDCPRANRPYYWTLAAMCIGLNVFLWIMLNWG